MHILRFFLFDSKIFRGAWNMLTGNWLFTSCYTLKQVRDKIQMNLRNVRKITLNKGLKKMKYKKKTNVFGLEFVFLNFNIS